MRRGKWKLNLLRFTADRLLAELSRKSWRIELVESVSINAGDVGDVFGRLQSPFDLEARNARVDELPYQVVGREVLRAEKIFSVAKRDDVAIAHQIIRHATRLRALAAIGAAAAERFAGQALT